MVNWLSQFASVLGGKTVQLLSQSASFTELLSQSAVAVPTVGK